MKTLMSLLVILSASLAHAKPDCSHNEYGLTKQSMVVVFDQSLHRFADITAQLDEGQFFFNELKDPSCFAVEVRAKEVRCISRSGYAIPVGNLHKIVGSYGDWQYHSVLWKSNVKIIWKYEELRGCMYGPAIQ
jgi:hypothetical protein